MDELVRAVCYEKEWAIGGGGSVGPACDAFVHEYGGGSVTPEANGLRSVRFHEEAYADPRRRTALPCGARTLFVRSDGGVALRGLNKFPEVEDVCGLLRDAAVQRAVCPMFIQRKMAGFIVVVGAAPDGDGLVVSSKHTLAGRHVDLARRMLAAAWGDDAAACEARLSAFLRKHGAAIVCEGVDPANDSWHPVSEPAALQGLTLLMVIDAAAVRERSLPHLVREAAAASKLTVVPTYPLCWKSFWATLDACAQWRGNCDDAAASSTGPEASGRYFDDGGDINGDAAVPVCGTSEGFVATFSVPSAVVARVFHGAGAGASAALGGSASLVYFRVKVKTLRYKIQRLTRGVLEQVARAGVDARDAGRGFRAGAVAKVVELWPGLAPHDRLVVADVFPRIDGEAEEEVAEAAAEEDCDCDGRDKPSVLFKGAQLSEMFDRLEARSPAVRAYLHGLRPPVSPAWHTLVMAVGLPGCGKSTAFEGMARQLVARGSDVLYLARDDVTQALRVRHDKADVTRQVHQEVRRIIEQDVLKRAENPAVVVLDGCHLTPGARVFVAKFFRRVVFVNFSCTPALCRERVAARAAHPTLGQGGADVVDLLAKRLQFHAATKKGASPHHYTVSVDTAASSPDAVISTIVQRVADCHFASGAPQAPSPTLRRLGPRGTDGGSSSGSDAAAAAADAVSKVLLAGCGLAAPYPTRISALNYVCVRGACSSLGGEGVAAGVLRRIFGSLFANASSPSPWEEAREAVFAALAECVAPQAPPQDATDETAAAAADSAVDSSDSVRLVGDGLNVQWLHGAMQTLLYKERGQEGAPRSVLDALRKHYRADGRGSGGGNGDDARLHCTLLHCGGRVPEGDGAAEAAFGYVLDEQSLDGARCELVCDEVVCDGKAVCLSVSAVRRVSCFGLSREPLPLPPSQVAHITLGTSQGTAPKHSLHLLQSISAWQSENHAAEVDRKRRKTNSGHVPAGESAETSIRKRKKEHRSHNFLTARVHPPVVLTGHIAYVPLQ
eukprot:Rhum_TRINITY_DN15549_c0_g1::Rhum_TRINITY_DN15549_c0_g1_i1::g.161182::m.161182